MWTHLSLAELLVQNQDFDKAKNTLAKVSVEDEKDRSKMVRVIIYLRALIDLRFKKFDSAISAFEKSRELGEKRNILHFYLAQACYGAGQYKRAQRVLGKSQDSVKKMPGYWKLNTSILWKLGQKYQAWKILEVAIKKFPKVQELERQKLIYLMDLGLFQRAMKEIGRYRKIFSVTGEEYLFFTKNLLRFDQKRKATVLLEEAGLLFPGNELIQMARVRNYLRQEMPYAATRTIQKLALTHSSYAAEASELLRKEAFFVQSKAFNGRITQSDKKIKGRLTLMLELKNFELAVALEDRIERVGMDREEDVQYALAYAHFMLGNFDRVEKHLKKIRRDELYQKALALRKTMQECRTKGWICL